MFKKGERTTSSEGILELDPNHRDCEYSELVLEPGLVSVQQQHRQNKDFAESARRHNSTEGPLAVIADLHQEPSKND